MLVSTDCIVLLELSVVTNTEHHLLAARYHKEDRYGPLLNDLEQGRFSVNLVTIEVGCLGHFMPETVSKLSDVCHLPKTTICCTFQQAARVAISCSYRTFNSCASLTWGIVDLFICCKAIYVYLFIFVCSLVFLFLCLTRAPYFY